MDQIVIALVEKQDHPLNSIILSMQKQHEKNLESLEASKANQDDSYKSWLTEVKKSEKELLKKKKTLVY